MTTPGYWQRHNARIAHTRTLRLGPLRLTYVPRAYRKTAADKAYEARLATMARQAR